MINIVEIIKSLPMHTKLYSRTFGDVYYDGIINDDYGNFDAILCICYLGSERCKKNLYFNEFGKLSLIFGDLEIFTQECDLFYDKQCNSWNKIFKNGDVLYSEKTKRLYLVKGYASDYELYVHCQVDKLGFIDTFNLKIGSSNLVFANPEQAEFLFSSLDKHNYKWIHSNKELILKHKPIFKLDDYIEKNGEIRQITQIGELAYHCGDGSDIRFENQNEWHLHQDSYDFKPFQKVLVRDNEHENWSCNLFDHIDDSSEYKFVCLFESFKFCIPYNDETKHMHKTNKSL